MNLCKVVGVALGEMSSAVTKLLTLPSECFLSIFPSLFLTLSLSLYFYLFLNINSNIINMPLCHSGHTVHSYYENHWLFLRAKKIQSSQTIRLELMELSL